MPNVTWKRVDRMYHEIKENLQQISEIEKKLKELKSDCNTVIEEIYDIILEQPKDIVGVKNGRKTKRNK